MCYNSSFSSSSTFLINRDYVTQCTRKFLVYTCGLPYIVCFSLLSKVPWFRWWYIVVCCWTCQVVLLWLPTRCQQCNPYPRNTREPSRKVKSEQIIKCSSRVTRSLGHSEPVREQGEERRSRCKTSSTFLGSGREGRLKGLQWYLKGLQWYLKWAPWWCCNFHSQDQTSVQRSEETALNEEIFFSFINCSSNHDQVKAPQVAPWTLTNLPNNCIWARSRVAWTWIF